VDAGCLDPGEEQEDTTNLRYVSTEKLKRLKREMLHPASRHRYFRYAITEPATQLRGTECGI
jgi:hypothetical protein